MGSRLVITKAKWVISNIAILSQERLGRMPNMANMGRMGRSVDSISRMEEEQGRSHSERMGFLRQVLETTRIEEVWLGIICSNSDSSKITKDNLPQEVQAHLAPLVSLQQVCQQCLNTNNKRANTKIKLKDQVPTISISNRAHRFRISSVSSEPSLLYREIQIKEEVCRR